MRKVTPTVVFGREPLKGREPEFLTMILHLHEQLLLMPFIANGMEITAKQRRDAATATAEIMAEQFPGVTFSVQVEEVPER